MASYLLNANVSNYNDTVAIGSKCVQLEPMATCLMKMCPIGANGNLLSANVSNWSQWLATCLMQMCPIGATCLMQMCPIGANGYLLDANVSNWSQWLLA